MSCDVNDITDRVRKYLVDNAFMGKQLATDAVKSVVVCGERTTVEFTGIMNADAEKVFHAVLNEMPGVSLTVVFKFEGVY